MRTLEMDFGMDPCVANVGAVLPRVFAQLYALAMMANMIRPFAMVTDGVGLVARVMDNVIVAASTFWMNLQKTSLSTCNIVLSGKYVQDMELKRSRRPHTYHSII